MLSLVGARKIPTSVSFFKVSIYFAENKVQRIYTVNFYILSIFYRHISNIVNKNIFVRLFIYFNIIRIKIFYVDNINKKLVCSVFMSTSLTLLLIFNIQFLLICYFWSETVMNFFVLLDTYYHIKVNTNRYQ